MKPRIPYVGRGHRALRHPLALGTLAMLALAGCDTDSLLKVEDPEFASPVTLDSPEALPTLIAGGVGDFQVAYSGPGANDDALLTAVALFTDEHYSTDTFQGRVSMDRRDLLPFGQFNHSDPAFVTLHRARRSLDLAARAVETIAGPGDPRIARLRALEAYTYVALGENFCSGIPFSEVRDGQRVEGDPLSTTQVFEAAVARLRTALAVEPGNNLARVGLGRALLDLGRHREAADAVKDVPPGFVYFVQHSANSFRQQNPVFAFHSNRRYSFSNDEGGSGTPHGEPTRDGEGLTYRAADPRIPWSGPVPGLDGTPSYVSLRYSAFGSDVPLASYVEAQLVLAEAELRDGRPAEFMRIVNSLRASVQSHMAVLFPEAVYPAGFPRTLAPLPDPGSPAARVDLLFRERAFWLFTTGHRLSDLRRLVRQYGRQQATVFPTGRYFKGGVYGTDVAFPIPFDEVNNTRFDPVSCDTKQA